MYYLVNGSLCAWADAVGDCPVSCGGLGLSLMPQTRECGCPAPAHGGGDCEGERTRDIDCGVASCPREYYNKFTFKHAMEHVTTIPHKCHNF